jgi:hypothetical protein
MPKASSLRISSARLAFRIVSILLDYHLMHLPQKWSTRIRAQQTSTKRFFHKHSQNMFLKARAHKTEDARYHKCKKPGLSVEEGAKDPTTSSTKIPEESATAEESLNHFGRRALTKRLLPLSLPIPQP